MDLNDIRHFAIGIKGDDYYEEYRLLKEDLDYFTVYINRNRKSAFSFTLIPCQSSTYTAFKDIYEAFGLYNQDLENAYAIYTVMKAIIISIYNREHDFNNSQIKEFAKYIKDDLNLDIEEYVVCFVGCGHGVADTKKKLHEIIHSGEDEVFTV